MKHTSEQILSFAENELIEKESIRRTVLSEHSQKEKKPIAWTKILLPIAACLILLCGTVLAIPSARAEVFSWFGVSTPQDYLTTDPDNRVPVDALDILIVPPAVEPATDTAEPSVPESPETAAPISNETPEAAAPIGSVTNNRILTVCDEPIWQQIAADFSMELGETMFDGHDLYMSITMKGLCALPEIEPYIGGSATQVRVGEKDLAEYFEDGKVPEAYKNGTVSLYEPMKGRFYLRLDDGTEIPFGPQYTIDFPQENPFHKHSHDLLTDADRAEISREAIEWLSGRELKGVLKKRDIDQDRDYFFRNGDIHDLVEVDNVLNFLLDRTGENGILSGTVRYVVGSDVTGSYCVRLEAELGTASFDLKAYQRIARQSTEVLDGTVTWDAETVLISKVGVDFNGTDDNDDDRISLYKQLASMNGVTMTAETEQAEISALGIRNIRIRIRMPESWTQEDREALAASLTFDVLINGERGDWIVSPYNCETEDDGTVLYNCIELLKVPYDKLTSIQTVSFVPVIRTVETFDMQTQDESSKHHESIGILDTAYGETTWSPYGVTGWNETFNRLDFPQYAITLHVN